jgi:hypothetical protein
MLAYVAIVAGFASLAAHLHPWLGWGVVAAGVALLFTR